MRTWRMFGQMWIEYVKSAKIVLVKRQQPIKLSHPYTNNNALHIRDGKASPIFWERRKGGGWVRIVGSHFHIYGTMKFLK